MRPYRSMYERLVANSTLADPSNDNSCWIWKGSVSKHGYPKVTVRINGRPQGVWAHRKILEEMHDCYFPFDHAAHQCFNTSCVNPMHLEIQTAAQNLAERRGYAPSEKGKSWIPVLFPRDVHPEPPL